MFGFFFRRNKVDSPICNIQFIDHIFNEEFLQLTYKKNLDACRLFIYSYGLLFSIFTEYHFHVFGLISTLTASHYVGMPTLHTGCNFYLYIILYI